MNAIDRLLACAGQWRGTNRLILGHNAPPSDSASTLSITPLLRDTFVRIDQSWSHENQSQEGSMLIGFDLKTSRVALHWIDTFHNGRVIMICTGAIAENAIDVLGSYGAPPGPDWGWRIEIVPTAPKTPPNSLAIRMFNITPTGIQTPAVICEYQR